MEDARILRLAGLGEFVNRCRDIRLKDADLYVSDEKTREFLYVKHPEIGKSLSQTIRLLSSVLPRFRGASANIKVRTMDQAALEGKPGAWVKVEAYRYSLA